MHELLILSCDILEPQSAFWASFCSHPLYWLFRWTCRRSHLICAWFYCPLCCYITNPADCCDKGYFTSTKVKRTCIDDDGFSVNSRDVDRTDLPTTQKHNKLLCAPFVVCIYLLYHGSKYTLASTSMAVIFPQNLSLQPRAVHCSVFHSKIIIIKNKGYNDTNHLSLSKCHEWAV